MMKKTSLYPILGILALLVIGGLFFRLINSTEPIMTEEEDFRTWFWEKRGLDLVVQVLLVFAGALGIAAILPVEDEDG